MKNWKTKSFSILLILVLFVGCDKSDDTTENTNALVLPPFESMIMDLDVFQDNSGTNKSTDLFIANKEPNGNWFFSKIVVGVWNVAVFNTLAIPVSAFRLAFDNKPDNIGDNTWQWSYDVDGFTSQYTARLTGEVTGEEVLWKMYITKDGIEGFDEFLWFSGSSAMDGNSGNWLLNESPEKPEAILKIEWQREAEEVGKIKYTWVRVLDEEEKEDKFKDSSLEYGLQEGSLDAYINAYIYDANLMDYSDVRIEWSRETYEGRVRSFNYFENEDWHCWNNQGEDISCE